MPHASATALDAPALRDTWDRRIREHDRRVVLSLLAMGLRPDRAREIAQATWARLFEKDVRGELADIVLPGLAIRQARFLAGDALRRDAADQRRLENVVRLTPPQPAPAVDDRVLCKQQIDRALTALADCSTSAQRVFRILYTPPPRSQTDAARELGLSVQRVRQIVCETRKKLRDALDEDSQ